ncbi:MAG: hypothetical protein NC177_01950 [Ruminococcus flavefaciens]|nr:hypothetical protein [Ruminococcus flavefaciens]
MFRTEIIFFLVVIANITALFFITKNFFRIDKFNGKKSACSIVAKVFSVVLNLAFFVGVFGAVVLGIRFISAMNVSDCKFIFTYNFKMGLILLETAFFLPYGLNFALYNMWYRKNNLPKWWIFPSLIIGVLAFIITVFSVITRGFINDWSQAEWIATSEFI